MQQLAGPSKLFALSNIITTIMFVPVEITGEISKEAAAASSSLPLDGRVAIVTGASRGIGHAISMNLHSLGARVVLNHASSSNQADLLAPELNASPSSSHP